MLLLPLAVTQEIKITDLQDNPGILPIHLGNARVRSKFHDFIHFFDLLPINDVLKSLRHLYLHASKTFLNKPNSTFYKELETHKKYYQHQLDLAEQKLKGLIPTIRSKRGLIDGLGTVIKGISGNLDANDAIHYETAIMQLQSNQKDIMKNLNSDVSLTGDIIEKFNETVSVLQQNLHLIVSQFQGMVGNFTKLYDNFYFYLRIRNIIEQMDTSINIVMEFINEIENALSFSKLGTLHHSVIKFSQLKNIIDIVGEKYSRENLIFADESQFHNYYELIKVDAYSTGSRIVFILHFPIVNSQTFSHYHLYSIPTINNTMIIPKNSYLTINDKLYQYTSSPCINLHTIFYCEINDLIEGSKTNDCIFQLLQLKKASGTCQRYAVSTNKNFIQQIDNSKFIAIFSNGIKIRTFCKRSDFTELKGNYLITVPKGCFFETKEEKYYNNKEIIKSQPMFLPKISDGFNTSTLSIFKIQLQDVSLDQIHILKRQQEKIHPLIADHYKTKNYLHGSLIGLIYVILIIIVIYFCYIKLKQSLETRNPSRSVVRDDGTEPNQVSFFSP